MFNLEKPGDYYQFVRSDFTNDYYDAEDDNPAEVVILTLPIYGVLTYNGNIILKDNFFFNIKDVHKLRYYRASSANYVDTIDFKVTDNNPNKKLSNMATFTINVNAYTNQPPSIGDNELTLGYGVTKTFSIADFTINTTPPYSDPEGDGPYKLKVTSLPIVGTLMFDGSPVTLNQEILFVDIGAGKFQYISDSGEIDGYVDDDFTFEISDLGSQQYSS